MHCEAKWIMGAHDFTTVTGLSFYFFFITGWNSMLVFSVWVSLQCVGRWVPIKWQKRLITDWRQTVSLLFQLKPEEERLKQMQKAPLSMPLRSSRSAKWQILHLHELCILIELLWRWTCLLHQHQWPHSELLSNSATGSNPVGCSAVKPMVWNPKILICYWLLWRWNGTAVKQEGSSGCWWITGLIPPCLQ